MSSTQVGHLLSDAQSLAEAGDFTAALAAARKAKTLEPRNVYVLAFEKQTEQLMEFSAGGTLAEEQRTDILESMPLIIEKAEELSRNSSGVTIISGLGSSKTLTDIERERKEKGAALEWLKNQYFQHAHEYVRKGEYQHALAEIRRVYIIDSANKVAQDFEKQIAQLAQMKTDHATRMHPSIIPPEPEAPRVTIAPRIPDKSPQDHDSVPMMAEEWSSPRELTRQRLPKVKKAPPAPVKEPENKRTALLMVLIFLALIVLGAAILWYYQRNVLSRRGPVDRRAFPPASSEQFLGVPGKTEEQSFVVTPIGTDPGNEAPQVTQVPGTAKPAPANLAGDQPMSTPEKTPARPTLTGSTPLTDNARRSSMEPRNPAAGSVAPLKTGTGTPRESTLTEGRNLDSAAAIPFTAVEKEAKIIRLQRPNFSPEAFQQGVVGQVVISVSIDAKGKPVETITLKSTNDVLIQPVIEAVMASKFSPAEVSTGPVKSWLTIPFKFTSKK